MKENNLPAILGREPRFLKQMILALAVVAFIFLVSDWPLRIIETMWQLVTLGRCPGHKALGPCVYLYEDAWASTKRVLPFLVGTFTALVMILFGALYPLLGVLQRWGMIVCYAIPSTALYLLLILLIGFGESAKIIGMIWIGFVIQAVFSDAAVRGFLYGEGTSTAHFEGIFRQLQLDGVNRIRLVWEHLIPLLAPQFFWGAIVVSVMAWKMTVVFEVIGTSGDGLGYMLVQSIKIGGEQGILYALAGIATLALCAGITAGVLYSLSHLHDRRVFRFRW